MNIISRAKAMFTNPKTEWLLIATERTALKDIFAKYVVPLALLPAVASFLGSVLFGRFFSVQYLILSAVITYAAQLISFFITTYVVDLLAPSFNAEKDINRSGQLIAYASTGVWIGGAFNIVPFLGILGSLAGGIYSLYLLYIGIMPMKKVADDKRLLYVIVTIVVLFVVYMILMGVFTAIFLTGMLGVTGMGRGLLG